MNLELRKFDMRSIQFPKGTESKGPVVVLIGKRDTGKSYLVRDLLYYQRDVPIGTVLSGSEAGNGFYGELVPRLFIHTEFNTVIIENVLKRQQKVVKQAKREAAAYGRTAIDGRAFVILDDMMFDKKWTKDKFMNYIFMNGRHMQIMLIITMQYVMGIPPSMRTNTDYVFILRENVIANRKRLYDNFAGMFPTFEAFCHVMDQCTENYECLVIHCGAKSNRLQDQVFWYKADPHPPFRLGSNEFWEMSRQMQDEDDDEGGVGGSSTPYDPTRMRKKSSAPALRVKKRV